MPCLYLPLVRIYSAWISAGLASEELDREAEVGQRMEAAMGSCSEELVLVQEGGAAGLAGGRREGRLHWRRGDLVAVVVAVLGACSCVTPASIDPASRLIAAAGQGAAEDATGAPAVRGTEEEEGAGGGSKTGLWSRGKGDAARFDWGFGHVDLGIERGEVVSNRFLSLGGGSPP